MITIVIPVHNRLALTRQCLQCLSGQTYRNYRIVVVDDGCTDGTGAMIAAEFPDVVVLRGDGSLWWTEATNWGVRYALDHRTAGETDFVLTLNDDTRVGPDYLQTLLDCYQQHAPCLVGSVSVDSNDPERLAYAGTALELYTAGGRDLAADYQYSYPKLAGRTSFVETDTLPGRGTLIPVAVFDSVGLYDSRHYIHYMSDIEFSVRAAKAGYRLVVSVASVVQEYVEATSSLITHKATWREFWQGLTSFKSPTHLKIRYRFAVTHTKTRQLYFLCDLSRICMGFALRKAGIMAK